MQKGIDKTEVFEYNKDNKNKERKKEKSNENDEKQKNLSKGGTNHRTRKFRLAFKNKELKV